MDAPPEALAGYTWHPVVLGRSGAEVFRLAAQGRPTLFLKRVAAASGSPLHDEAARLTWLQGKVPVPDLVHLGDDAHTTYLVTTAVPGLDLTRFNHETRAVKSRLAAELARALRRFHALEPRGCPFDQGAGRALELLWAKLAEREASADRRGLREARAKLAALRQRLPKEDLVLTHGDACLPNVLVQGGQLSGFIDLGAAGLGDRYRDLERACWSLNHNYGEGYDEVFLAAYGIVELDEVKLDFYRQLAWFSLA